MPDSQVVVRGSVTGTILTCEQNGQVGSNDIARGVYMLPYLRWDTALMAVQKDPSKSLVSRKDATFPR